MCCSIADVRKQALKIGLIKSSSRTKDKKFACESKVMQRVECARIVGFARRKGNPLLPAELE